MIVASARRAAALQRLETALGEAGISQARFLDSAATAVSQMRRRWVADPAAQFSDEEQATLRAGNFDLSPLEAADDPAGDPVARSAARFAALLADSSDVSEVAAQLAVTPARIRQRASERSLYALREADELRFPRWQFDINGQPIRGLARVVAALPADLHPVASWRFLTEPIADLEVDGVPVSPLTWLESGGGPEPAARIARDL